MSELGESWAWPLRLRAELDRRPRLVDLVLAAAVDVATTLPLVGHEHRWWAWVLDQSLVLPLAVRRRAPFAVLLVISAVAFVQWTTGVRLPADCALFVALYGVANASPKSRIVLGTAVLELGAVLASVRFPADQNAVWSVVFVTGLVVATVLAGLTLRTRRAYLDQLVSNARQIEIDRAQETALAAGRERTRIAREMHDIVAHSVSVMVALADGASLTAGREPDQAAAAMGNVSAVGRQSLREMRRLLGVLREDSSPAALAPQPGLWQLPDLVEQLRLVGLTVDLVTVGVPRSMPQTQDLTAYRIVQESLTNVVKHASGATHVRVVLDWSGDRLRMSVSDDGLPGRGDGRHGHGLVGMTERASMFDGAVTAGPQSAGGWQVRAELPLQPVG